ncbi:GxxExxY protein [Cecembia rubra]|uniref:GxxExxY protein n=1 Tax=Cecembia rubra TaxID=1485585 RepID=UPI002715507A|nr:GxxExxY protein [Cecembia rubra]
MYKKMITQMSYDVLGCAINVHREVGPGLLESVYQKCLIHELKSKGFKVMQQVKAPLFYKDLRLEVELKADIIVNESVIIELKTVDCLLPVHEAQILTYMRLLKIPQGLLMNFYSDNLSKNTIPLVNEYFKALPE